MNFLKGLRHAAPSVIGSVRREGIRPLGRVAPRISAAFQAPRYLSTEAYVTETPSPFVPASFLEPVEVDKLYKRVELEMRGIDPAVLLSYSWFCMAAASHLGIQVTKSWALRKADKERFTLLRAVHIYKKHKVQYEIRTYFRFVHLQRLTESTCDTYLEYIERNLPEGCALKVTKVECQALPEHLKGAPKEE